MTFQQEFASWFAPTDSPTTSPIPNLGGKAPTPSILHIQPKKRTIIAFLRHCGCPFAEKTYIRMRESAKTHRDIDFIAISHSSPSHTETWKKSLPQYGTEPENFTLIVDEKREAYAAYGLGNSTWMHVLSPASMYNVFNLASKEGIKNRPTESGSRWQQGGYFGINEAGIIKWGHPADRADDIPDFEEGVKSLAM